MNEQLDIDFSTAYDFDGVCYDPALDGSRLNNQFTRVYICMVTRHWRTLREISDITGDPEASVSAQLRHLRKKEYGGYDILKQRRGDPKRGCWEYKLSGKKEKQ